MGKIEVVAIPSYSEVLFLQPQSGPEVVEVRVVAIPSYSEVLFLQKRYILCGVVVSRNPFLFRGPIPTVRISNVCPHCLSGRNPFLFRGPIPTEKRKTESKFN